MISGRAGTQTAMHNILDSKITVQIATIIDFDQATGGAQDARHTNSPNSMSVTSAMPIRTGELANIILIAGIRCADSHMAPKAPDLLALLPKMRFNTKDKNTALRAVARTGRLQLVLVAKRVLTYRTGERTNNGNHSMLH